MISSKILPHTKTLNVFNLSIVCFILFNSVFQVYNINLNGLVIDDGNTNEQDESNIVSESKNITVYSNQTVVLQCLVRATPNTIIIWNQCDDPSCDHVRSPLTINKDNFIEDLRFRVLTENVNELAVGSSSVTVKNGETEVENEFGANLPFKRNINSDRDVNAGAGTGASETDHPSSLLNVNEPQNGKLALTSWNLEIRKFSKNDEACYQCQLNSFKYKAIHYCLTLKTRVTARPKKLTIKINDPIKLKCYSDENVRLSSVRWYHNGHRLSDENITDFVIEKKVLNDHIYTSLYIKQANEQNSGTYVCKFGHLNDKIFVDVVPPRDERIKSSEIRSNQEDSEVLPSISQSISDAMFSSSSSSVGTSHFTFTVKFVFIFNVAFYLLSHVI